MCFHCALGENVFFGGLVLSSIKILILIYNHVGFDMEV